MFRLLLCLALLCWAGRFSVAAPFAPQPGLDAASLCRPAIEAAERRHGIPARLLAAIGRVESGRRDPVNGNWNPWPWTINAEGEGAFFDTKAQAIAAVRGLQARGVRSIDVGCMQINLMHHPDAFASPEQPSTPPPTRNTPPPFWSGSTPSPAPGHGLLPCITRRRRRSAPPINAR